MDTDLPGISEAKEAASARASSCLTLKILLRVAGGSMGPYTALSQTPCSVPQVGFEHLDFAGLSANKCEPLSCVRLFVTPWTVAHQTPLSIGILPEEHTSGLACPSPGYLPNPGIEPRSLALQADSLLPQSPGKTLDNKKLWLCLK